MLVTDELVVIGTDDGDGHVYAFEKNTGSVWWMFPAGRGVATDIIRFGERVYAVTLEDHIVCLELDTGRLVWTVPTGAEPPDRYTMGSTPAISDSVVYFGGLDGAVRALTANTGSELWQTDLGAQIVTSTLLLDDAIVVGAADARLYRLAAHSGVIVDTVDTPGKVRGHLVATADSLIYAFLTGDRWQGDLTAVDRSLDTRWTVAAPEGSDWTSARPFLFGPWILAGTNEGRLYALDRSTGRIAWSHDVDADRDWSNDAVRVFGFHDGVLFVGTFSGMLYAFDVTLPQAGEPRAIR
jgi:outer membrane protein assembly factor BamB